MPKVALVQLPSPFLDRAGAFEVAERAISEARREGAELVVFPETPLQPAGRLPSRSEPIRRSADPLRRQEMTTAQ